MSGGVYGGGEWDLMIEIKQILFTLYRSVALASFKLS